MALEAPTSQQVTRSTAKKSTGRRRIDMAMNPVLKLWKKEGERENPNYAGAAR